MEWLKQLPDSSFTSRGARARLLSATTRMDTLLPVLAMHAWPSVAAAMHECARSGCTASTCRLCRGCVLATVTSLQSLDSSPSLAAPANVAAGSSVGAALQADSHAPEEEAEPAAAAAEESLAAAAGIEMEWLSPLELSRRLHSTALLRAALRGSGEPAGGSGGMLVAVLMPEEMLVRASVVVPGGCPGPGIIGWLQAIPRDLVAPFARYCHSRGLNPSALQRPGQLSLLKIASHCGHETIRPPPAMLQSAAAAAAAAREGAAGRPPGERGGERAGERLAPELETGLYWLQVTINSFWQLVHSGSWKLSHRIKKASPGLDCLLLRPVSLCSQLQPCFTYVHKEILRSSRERKIRCDRVTAHTLVVAGLSDVRLLCELAALDPEKQYMVVLQLPEQLAGPYIKGGPPSVLSLSSDKAGDVVPGRGGNGDEEATAAAAASGTAGAMGAAEMARTASAGAAATSDGVQVPPNAPGAAGRMCGGLFLWCVLPHPDPLDLDSGLSGLARQQQQLPELGQAWMPGKPKFCCLPSCGLSEHLCGSGRAVVPLPPSQGAEAGGSSHVSGSVPLATAAPGFEGIRLLTCSGCRATHYCTPEHQSKHWRDHRQACLAAAALSGAATSPRAGGAASAASGQACSAAAVASRAALSPQAAGSGRLARSGSRSDYSS